LGWGRMDRRWYGSLLSYNFSTNHSQVCLTNTIIYSPACAGSAFDEVVQIKRECAGVDGCGNPSNRTHFYGYIIPLSLLSIYSFPDTETTPHLQTKTTAKPRPPQTEETTRLRPQIRPMNPQCDSEHLISQKSPRASSGFMLILYSLLLR
jgi:hypothetical protein